MPLLAHQQRFFTAGGPLVIFAAISEGGSVTVEAECEDGAFRQIAPPITAASSATPIHMPVSRTLRCSISGTVTRLEYWK